MFLLYVSIAMGGSIGACSRYGVSTWVNQHFPHHLALGTLTVNVLGSLFIGLLFVLLDEKLQLPASYKPFLVAGFLGSFTTFSSFSLETLNHIQQGHYVHALSYTLLSVLLCLLACFVGAFLAKLL